MIKALIVGINKYPGAALAGCVNDGNDVIDYLINNELVDATEILPLYDERATKDAIVHALRDMLASSSPGDNLLFHFSGHGASVPSPQSSDGYEQVLCPVDFTFQDASTWITESEIAAITSSVPSKTALTMVTDACHSGGLTRAKGGGTPRCYPPPDDIAFLLRTRKRLIRPRDLSGANALLIAACAANETAADSAFGNGRANGAFTYYWLKELGTDPKMAVDAVIQKTTSDLAGYSMHPFEDGPSQLVGASFMQTPAPVPRDFGLPPIIKRSEIVWEQTWTTKLFGMDMGLGVSIAMEGSNFELDLSCNGFRWPIPLSGNLDESFDIAMGFRLVLSVGNWSVSGGMVAFQLGISVAPPFFPPVKLVDIPVAFPMPQSARALVPPASATELLALIDLAERARPAKVAVPPPSAPRDESNQWTGIAWVESFAGGLFGCRYEKNVDAYVPPGFLRDHIEITLETPNSGNVYFLDWEDSDPHIGRFRFHVGCVSCGGGRATFYMHCVRDPNVINRTKEDAEQPARIVIPVVAPSAPTPTPRRNANGESSAARHLLAAPTDGV